IDSETAATSFYSTVHGAGRVMSRTEARGRYIKDPQTGKKLRQPGRVRHDEMQAWLRAKGVHLIGGDLDEAPQASRRLPDVPAPPSGRPAGHVCARDRETPRRPIPENPSSGRVPAGRAPATFPSRTARASPALFASPRLAARMGTARFLWRAVGRPSSRRGLLV